MNNRTHFSRLFAFGLGVSCCLSGYMLFSPGAEAESAIQETTQEAARLMAQRLEELDFNRSRSHVRELYQDLDCQATNRSAARELEFVQSLLVQAEGAIEQVENPYDQETAWRWVGLGYACAGQYEKADTALQKAIALADDNPETLVLVAGIYGALMDDADRMNAMLSEVIATRKRFLAEPSDWLYEDWVLRLADIYARQGQYQPLRNLVDSTEDSVRREKVMEVASVRLVDSLNGESNRLASPAEREAIRRLFSDFDIEALAAEVSARMEDYAGTTAEDSLWVDYINQLHHLPSEDIEQASDDSIENFIAEQKLLIDRLPEGAAQALAYTGLSDLLSHHGQSERALQLLKVALQAFDAAPVDPAISSAPSGYEIIQWAIVTETIRSGDFDLGLQLAQAFLVKRSAYDAINQWLLLPGMLETRTLALTNAQHTEIIDLAQALVPEVEANSRDQFFVVVRIAIAHVEAGNIETARELIQPIETLFAASDGEFWPYNYLRLLARLGEKERAIELASSLHYDTYASLPAHFLEAGRHDVAEELFATLTATDDRVRAARSMVQTYHFMNMPREALTLAVEILDEVQRDDLRDNISGLLTYDRSEEDVFLQVETKRAEMSESLIYPFSPDGHISTEEIAEASESLAINLIESINRPWIRSQLIQNLFPTETALHLFEQDPELEIPDSVFVESVEELVDDTEFEAAANVAEKVRSPYIQSRALSYIANRYMARARHAFWSNRTED